MEMEISYPSLEIAIKMIEESSSLLDAPDPPFWEGYVYFVMVWYVMF